MKKLTLLLFIAFSALVVYIAFPYYNLYKAKNFDNLTFSEPSISIEIEQDIPFNELADYLLNKELIKDAKAFNLLVNYKNYSDAILLISLIPSL